MRSVVRSLVLASSVSGVLIALSACAGPSASTTPSAIVLNQAAPYQGKVVGPIVRGQPEDGTGFKSFELELDKAVAADDKAICGAQEVLRLPIEKDGMASYLGKTVRLTATAYCRESRTGTYHLRDVTDIRVLR